MNQDARLYTQFDIQPYHIRDFLLGLARYYHLPQSVRFLDVGCGPGRLLLPMAAEGWLVSALEPSPDYVSAAMALQAQSDNILHVAQGGFSHISQTNAYDLIAAVNNPFAYLLTNSERRDALQRMYTALRPGGVLFLDFFNLLWHLRYFRQPEPAMIPQKDGSVLRRIIQHTVDFHDSTLTHTDIFYRNDTYLSTQTHKLAIVAPQTIFSLVAEAGFTTLTTFNSYAKVRPERISGKRIMISAQKPV